MNSNILSDRLLRTTLFLLLLGIFWQLFTGGSISSMLFMNVGLSEKTAVNSEKIFALLFLLIGVFTIFSPKAWLLILLAFLLFFVATTIHISAGKHYSELSVFAQFARIVVPVSLLFLIKQNQQAMTFVLRLGLSFTFLTHGWEAWQANPVFVDYLIGFSGMSLGEHNAILLLKSIGILDLASALFLWAGKAKVVLYWVIFWGFATAAIRVLDAGWENIAEFLVRVPNFMLGIVLLIFLNKSKNVQH